MVLFLENQTLISNNFIFIQSSIAKTKQMNSSSWGNIVVLLYFELKNNNKHKIRGGGLFKCFLFPNMLDILKCVGCFCQLPFNMSYPKPINWHTHGHKSRHPKYWGHQSHQFVTSGLQMSALGVCGMLDTGHVLSWECKVRLNMQHAYCF